jgi:hypothetical protein
MIVHERGRCVVRGCACGAVGRAPRSRKKALGLGKGHRNRKQKYPNCPHTGRSALKSYQNGSCKKLNDGRACEVCRGVMSQIRIARYQKGAKCWCGGKLASLHSSYCRACQQKQRH